MLDNGDVVARFQSSFNDESADAPSDIDDREETDRWFHVSGMSFNPYRPSWREVIWPGRVVNEHGHVLLKATHSYYNLMQMVESLYMADSNWDLRVYTLIDDDTPIDTCDPCQIRVRHFPAPHLDTYGFRKKRAPKPKPKPEQKDPVMDALLDLHGDGSEQSDGTSDSGGDEGTDHGDGKGSTSAEESVIAVVAPPTPPVVTPPPSPTARSDSSVLDLFWSSEEVDEAEDHQSSSSSSSDSIAEDPVGTTLRQRITIYICIYM